MFSTPGLPQTELNDRPGRPLPHNLTLATEQVDQRRSCGASPKCSKTSTADSWPHLVQGCHRGRQRPNPFAPDRDQLSLRALGDFGRVIVQQPYKPHDHNRQTTNSAQHSPICDGSLQFCRGHVRNERELHKLLTVLQLLQINRRSLAQAVVSEPPRSPPHVDRSLRQGTCRCSVARRRKGPSHRRWIRPHGRGRTRPSQQVKGTWPRR
jgi:hypothetical protein